MRLVIFNVELISRYSIYRLKPVGLGHMITYDVLGMDKLHKTLILPHPISLKRTIRAHGWVDLKPWEWDENLGILTRLDRLQSGIRKIEIKQSQPNSVDVALTGDQVGKLEINEAIGLVSRWISADWIPKEAIAKARQLKPDIATFIEEGGGRYLRGSTFYEDFIKTICTIQIAWSGSKRMVAALVSNIGGGVFPTPLEIIEAGEKGLRERARIGFRAKVTAEATEKLLTQGVIDTYGNTGNRHVSYVDLLAIRGIGPYAAGHMSVLQHDFSRIPVDSEVEKYCYKRYGIGPNEVDSFFESWGKFKFLGYRIAKRLG